MKKHRTWSTPSHPSDLLSLLATFLEDLLWDLSERCYGGLAPSRLQFQASLSSAEVGAEGGEFSSPGSFPPASPSHRNLSKKPGAYQERKCFENEIFYFWAAERAILGPACIGGVGWDAIPAAAKGNAAVPKAPRVHLATPLTKVSPEQLPQKSHSFSA